jgi:hypothetical protein
MTRPRRRVSDAAASRNHPPASLAPPLWARGWCGPVLPLAPSRRRRVIVRDLHHGHPIATAGAGTGGTVSTVVGVVLTAATVAASCREPAATSVSRGSPDAATTLPTAAARGALDERCLMGTDAPNLSTLAGASSGTVGATLRTKTQDQAPAPRNRGCLGGTLPTTNSRGPVSSFARARLWPPRRLSPPLLRSLTPSRRSPASLRCARPPLLTARWRVSLRPLRALAPLPPLRPSTTGVGDSTSRGGARPPSLSSSSSFHDDEEFSGVAGGESPCCSRSRYSSL